MYNENTKTDITIVTSFFDIKRYEWTPDKGLPHYLYRTVDTYVERFRHMWELKNPLILYTTEDMLERITTSFPKREDSTTLICMENPAKTQVELIDRIRKVQTSEAFQKIIHPSQVKNPEYWSPEYVLINFMKSFYAKHAIENGHVKTKLVSCIDFGYFRSADKLPKSRMWNYPFDETKVHFFGYKEFDPKNTIQNVIATNDVHILGAQIVGGRDVWIDFISYMHKNMEILLNNNLVDDDQTLMLMCYLSDHIFFKMHPIPDHQFGHDPFVLFQKYNTYP